ncbi:hypothetical protein N7539_003710 [Penicillium diatomitis]|uniref:Box C/D snoRNA protein 1 n=1 Tax=Penicillium diatomitis TaxID=2819901 RepID=A0A9W9XCE5_9EURO|nr:uncharacterized protein N7539_003710 [Penicillium diatomitis]KAJ5488820.1 hypothetical protein N7539_003710 [Penicillium diatomitis]
MDNSDPLLSELCSICHVNPPKYRCPRCATRTCSLPCSRRHKLWSQCSGVRDPAAYLKRSELASEAAFDRDFNFITGIERTLERAERDAENRGIDLTREPVGNEEDDIPNDAATDPVGAGRKRKHPTQGLVKGEAGFLRGAEAGAVRVLRAPRGMSRNTQNTSRWHPKHKCLSWTVEWVSATGDKTVRNALETYQVSDAYDRAFPPPKEARAHTDGKKDDVVPGNERSAEQTSSEANNPDHESADTKSQAAASESAGEKGATPLIDPHRNLYFYLHRPRTSTKKPVIVPLPPSETLHTVLRDRTVLEFPTIYVLTDSAETIRESKETYPFILEEEYLHSAPQETRDETTESDQDEPAVPAGTSQGTLGVNIENVDEKTVMEVLKQDLFENIP